MEELELQASQEAPPSRIAPPSPAKSNIIIATAADPTDDLKQRCRTVHSYLRSAKELSQELKSLETRQQMQRMALEHRIDEYYQRAYDDMSQRLTPELLVLCVLLTIVTC